MPNKVAVYNQKGEKVKDITLSPAVFAVKVNPTVVHQVVVSMQSSARQNLAHVKDKSEVSGGGRKPWRQKGTGRARHGSSRSPIWIGGGVTFGPTKDINFLKKVNKKMRRRALLMTLTDRANSETLKILDGIVIAEGKTKSMVETLNNLKLTKSILLVTSDVTPELVRATSNIQKVEIIDAKNLNPVTVLKYQNLVVTEAALPIIEKTFVNAVKKTAVSKVKVEKAEETNETKKESK
ncbi:50S ribosomal protein L4 [Candidatus Falkowbacteria bacterium CG10_big_fil_rev_8_21_14_0_10_39_11]|uniref:Large ribosomal subunit protein uL4 n=1 Tax=Candidatus Falkowbacteria bacterium CG10_big_fil_rev_8_21_14_0_10_39_11 TaxID=1974565 RepID=A0A2H0V3T0_9BACT|nr:MAG: 50S ribosomal protein L4 [Candidatus Falkowbacteria bacterium CG10_big_fil_rev_8_21_14_0_10_39_11]